MSIIQTGRKVSIVDVTNVHTSLPPKNYILKFNELKGEYFLIEKNNFVLPQKIYGDHSIINRWLKSYKHNNEKNMGILLSGIKGSGKTITAQKFCIDSKKPVIIINQNYYGSEFIDFLTLPELSGSIIFIDEFEKIYGRNGDIEDLLSIMDGNYFSNLIFLLTVNDMNMSEYLINRLGRIKYRKHYNNLEKSVMDEVIKDLLINKKHVNSIYEFFDKINICTFDLLINLIKEMNLFNEDALQCGQHLNLKPEVKFYNIYEIINDKKYECFGTHFDLQRTNFEIERKTTNIKTENYSKELDFRVNIDLNENWKLEKKSKEIYFINSKTEEKFVLIEQDFNIFGL